MDEKSKNKVVGVYQRKGRTGWYVRYTHGGKTYYEHCPNKPTAIALRSKRITEIFENNFFPQKRDQKITLGAWIDRYIETRPSSVKGLHNEKNYREHWKTVLGDRLLSDISRDDLQHIQAKMKASGDYADGTINRYFSFIRRIFSLAVKDEKLFRNPVEGISWFNEASRDRFLSDDEINELRGVMDADDFKLVAFAILTGLRQSEQFGLDWKYVDLENRVLTIPMSKSGKTRHVPLNEEALTILRSLNMESSKVFPLKSVDSFMANVYKTALTRAGIDTKEVCWHTLRHTAATKLVRAGVDLYAVGGVLGHLDVKTTTRYAHLQPDHLQEAVNRIGIKNVPKSSQAVKIETKIQEEKAAEVVELKS